MSNLFLWLLIIYIAFVVLWRLFLSIMLIVEEGWAGAVFAFFINLWDLTKFAFGILILILIVRKC